MNSSMLSSTRVKRNQFTNHNFFYVVYGDFTIYRNNSAYTFCTSSDDG